MTGAEIFALLSAIQAAIAAAPKVIAVVEDSKRLITTLFEAKLITKEQQDVCHATVDARAALVAQGIVPEHWQVQPD